ASSRLIRVKHVSTVFAPGYFRRNIQMNTLDTQFGKRVTNASLAVLAAVLLVAGASWGSLAAGAAGSEAQAVAAQQVTPAARGLAPGRDSYADIVKVVAPAVVTIR